MVPRDSATRPPSSGGKPGRKLQGGAVRLATLDPELDAQLRRQRAHEYGRAVRQSLAMWHERYSARRQEQLEAQRKQWEEERAGRLARLAGKQVGADALVLLQPMLYVRCLLCLLPFLRVAPAAAAAAAGRAYAWQPQAAVCKRCCCQQQPRSPAASCQVTQPSRGQQGARPSDSCTPPFAARPAMPAVPCGFCC